MLFSWWSLLLAFSAVSQHVLAHVLDEYIQQQIDSKANALNNFLQTVGPLGMPTCLVDEVREARGYGKNYKIIVPVVHLCEPVVEKRDPVGYSALSSRLGKMREAAFNLFSKDPASLSTPEKITKGVLVKLSGSTILEEQNMWIREMTHKLRPLPSSRRGVLDSAGQKSGGSFDLLSPRKRKTAKTWSFCVRKTDASVSYRRMSCSQNHFGFFHYHLSNDRGTQQYRSEIPSYCTQRVLNQVQSFSMSNLRPDSTGQILRPTALRPNSGRTRSTNNNRQEMNEHSRQPDIDLNPNPGNARPSKHRRLDSGSRFTIASIFGNHVQSSSGEESQDTET